MSDNLALRFDEPLSYGIRRVARLLVDDALHWCEHAENDVPTAVHEIRKRCKELRAVVRLIRDRLGPRLYRLENDSYRDIARLLSDTRDGHVLVDTFRYVAKSVDQHLPTEITHRLIRHFQTRDRRGVEEMFRTDRLGQIAAQFLEARTRIDRWPLRHETFDLFAPGLRRVYRRGLRQMTTSRQTPTDAVLHDWRKRAKYLWYHVRILTGVWPAVMSGLETSLHDLSDCLGDDHDLAVLMEESRMNPDLNEVLNMKPFLEEVLRLRHGLIVRSWTLGRKVYAEQPKSFIDRTGTYVRTAQQENLAEL